MNDVLGNYRFEAGEMIEQEYLACFDLAADIVNLDIDSEPLMNERERADAPLISAFVDFELGSDIHLLASLLFPASFTVLSVSAPQGC